MNFTFTRTVKTYSRTTSGKCWKSQPDKVETETVNEQFYLNCTARETIRFFNRLGSCRAVYGYTCHGYEPIQITLINPDRSIKKVETWKIEYQPN